MQLFAFRDSFLRQLPQHLRCRPDNDVLRRRIAALAGDAVPNIAAAQGAVHSAAKDRELHLFAHFGRDFSGEKGRGGWLIRHIDRSFTKMLCLRCYYSTAARRDLSKREGIEKKILSAVSFRRYLTENGKIWYIDTGDDA